MNAFYIAAILPMPALFLGAAWLIHGWKFALAIAVGIVVGCLIIASTFWGMDGLTHG